MKVALDFEICEHNKISNFLKLRKQPHKQANYLTGKKVVQHAQKADSETEAPSSIMIILLSNCIPGAFFPHIL